MREGGGRSGTATYRGYAQAQADGRVRRHYFEHWGMGMARTRDQRCFVRDRTMRGVSLKENRLNHESLEGSLSWCLCEAQVNRVPPPTHKKRQERPPR